MACKDFEEQFANGMRAGVLGLILGALLLLVMGEKH